MHLVLASRSPRRAELLTRMGLRFSVRAADVDETPHTAETAAAYVERLAAAKARAVLAPDDVDVVALGADTAVVLDDRILGKPADREEGVAMLLALAGRRHRVMTGVAALGPAAAASRCVVTEVGFRPIERSEAEAYWRTGEGADKAGGYGIQGIGGIFVTSIRGSYSAVVGLPVAETEQILRDCGLDTWRERTHG